MPTYVYKHPESDETIEVTLSLEDVSDGVPERWNVEVGPFEFKTYKRVYTANAVHFKGSGFYSTSSRA